MMDGVSVTVHGLDVLEQQLIKLGHETGGKALRGAMMTATKPLADAIKEAAPVRSFADGEEVGGYVEGGKGTLKASIGRRAGLYKGGQTAKRFEEVFTSDRDTAAVIQVGAIKNMAWKAHFQEFGTIHNAPQPFILPVFESMTDDVVLRFKKSLARAVKKAAHT